MSSYIDPLLYRLLHPPLLYFSPVGCQMFIQLAVIVERFYKQMVQDPLKSKDSLCSSVELEQKKPNLEIIFTDDYSFLILFGMPL